MQQCATSWLKLSWKLPLFGCFRKFPLCDHYHHYLRYHLLLCSPMLPMIKPVQWQKWFTYKYSKCIWSQFLEDDWVGWSVSLEYLRRSNRNILEYNSLFCKNVFFNKVYIAMSIHVTGGHCPPNTRYSWKVFGGVNFFSCYNDLTLIWTKIRSLV